MTKREKLVAWVAGAVVTAAAALTRSARRRHYSYGGPDHRGISRDPAKLLPSFADALEILFQRLRALGFDPLLHEGYRTPARARELARQKKGKADSLHCYGAAADIISASRQWDHPRFFQALGREARKLGLTWGGDFVSRPDDLNHVQAVPGNAEDGLRLTHANHRDIYVQRFLRAAPEGQEGSGIA